MDKLRKLKVLLLIVLFVLGLFLLNGYMHFVNNLTGGAFERDTAFPLGYVKTPLGEVTMFKVLIISGFAVYGLWFLFFKMNI